MTSHLERYGGPCLLLFVLAAISPTAVDRLRTGLPLPAGYGAEGDRRRASPIPALIRPTVEDLATGAGGWWAKGCVEDGEWVYELHLFKDGRSAVIHLTSNGRVIQPAGPEPVVESGGITETGG